MALALGANLGEPAAALVAAARRLSAVPGLDLAAASAVVETDPVGGPPGQPAYLNAVLVGTTTLAPRAVLAAALATEVAAGRVRSADEQRWGPRVLDVDVLVVGDVVAAGPGLVLPHPRARERAFVLVPWAAADSSAVLPGEGGGRVADLAARALAAAGPGAVRRRDDVLPLLGRRGVGPAVRAEGPAR